MAVMDEEERAAPTFALARATESGGPVSRWLRRWGVALGAAIPLAFWVTLIVLHPHGSPPAEPTIMALVASTWLGPLAAIASRALGRRRVRARELRVTADRLVVVAEDGVERAWARGEIVQGVELGARDVALELASGAKLELALERDGDGARVLDAIGLGPTQRRAVFRWRRTFERLLGGVAGLSVLVGLLAVFPSPPLLALLCPMFAGVPWLFAGWLGGILSERSIEIGADALRARGRLTTVLARFAELEAVRVVETARGGRLELVFRDGRRVQALLDPDDDRMRAAVLARIEAARAAAASREEGQRLAELLGRAGRSLSELREVAANVLGAAIGFRDASVTESEVAALLDDPQAGAAQRIAAAIALAGQSQAGPARVRVVAERCASPKLRVALEAAATGALDDGMLAAAEEEAAGTGAARSPRPRARA